MQFTFAHNNFNVADLDASLAFYEKALGPVSYTHLTLPTTPYV